MRLTKIAAAIAAASLVASSAWATNGYAPHGIGNKAKGMGGAGVAFPQDALAGGMNPAGMALVGNRLDIGLEWFRPIRDSEISGHADPRNNTSFDGNDTKNFFIPEFGYNRVLNDKMTVGLSVFGTGGMNTDYGDGIAIFNGNADYPTRTGVDLAQLFIVPTFTYKLNEMHAIGIGVNLAGQRIRLKGLQNFANDVFSSSKDDVTNQGYDYSYGAGVRIGWIGKINDILTLGATYQSRTYMSEFDEYKGMLAEQGDFDIPENFAVGLAVKATPKLTVAFDVMRINYSDVNAIGNKGPSGLAGPPAARLGDDGGMGFGWDDQTVYKLGVAYELNPEWTLRAGYNYGKSPIDESETLFNMIAPAAVESHLTLGATWTLKSGSEVTFAYMHAFENEVKGSNSIPAFLGGGNANINMYQDSFGVTWSMPM